jgi:hypothetical protein
MYADVKYSLTGVLEWLEGTDETAWDRQIELGEECRSDMERTGRPIYRNRLKASWIPFLTPVPNTDADRLNKATPYVNAMLAAMRSRNRAAALEYGRAALAMI